jgi:uncharacterized protein YaaW (UPF0174 family)
MATKFGQFEDKSNRDLFKLLSQAEEECLIPLGKVLEVGPRKKQNSWADALVTELTLNGGNSILNVFRGNEGVAYSEIVTDVCGKLDLPTSGSLEEREKRVARRFLADFFEKLPAHLQKKILSEMGQEYIDWALVDWNLILPVLLGTLFSDLVIGGVGLALGELIGAIGLEFILGPVGLLAIPVVLLAGPAYRKTIPSVVIICGIRQIQKQK